MRFENKVVVITGGAGGVGQALVRLFAAEGARVMISDINADGCQAMVDQARELGAEADCLAGNLREKEYCEAVIARTVERFGGVDILLNNAGIIPRGTIEETTDEVWFTAMDVNLNAVFFLCRAAIPHMKR
ncbi:3-oxoacyl-[acyl-carrier-protein] reductase FabG [compost metagenome]